MQLCEKIADLWPRDSRNAAVSTIGGNGIKDPSAAAAGKLKAGALGTQRGAATATMPGAGAVRSDVTNSGVIPASGSALTNTGVGRRGTVAGHPVTGAAGATFRPQ